jgi:hypothetical protein
LYIKKYKKYFKKKIRVQKGFGNKQIKNGKLKEKFISHNIWGHGDQ